jgi:hypothetical protein
VKKNVIFILVIILIPSACSKERETDIRKELLNAGEDEDIKYNKSW